MNLTETQKRILNELTNEFETINNQFNKDIGTKNLFNPAPIIEGELENVRQVKELEAHNQAMFDVRKEMFEEICAMLNEDLKDTPMCCIEKKNVHSKETFTLGIAPIDSDGNPIHLDPNNSLNIYIEFVTKPITIGHKSYIKKIGFKFGSSETFFDTIEDCVNSDYFKKNFGKIYNKYCVSH